MTAMFDTRGAAETARDALVELGVGVDDIAIHGTESGTGYDPEAHRGFWASLADLFTGDDDREVYTEGVRRGGYLLRAEVPAELEERATEILEAAEPVDLDARADSWRLAGWSGAMGTMPTTPDMVAPTRGPGLAESSAAAPERRSAEDAGVIPVTEEQLQVGTRAVDRGRVRVRSFVTERPVEQQVGLQEERVRVERRPVDRPVSDSDSAFREREIEAVERGEEAVVSKQARVTEEIELHKDRSTRTETVRDTVRKQDVEVQDERVGGTSR